MAKKKRGYFTCPHCGANVAAGAVVCRECGADSESGWSEDADDWSSTASGGYDEEDDFEYEEYLEREFPGSASPSADATVRKWFLRVVVGLLIGSFILVVLFHG